MCVHLPFVRRFTYKTVVRSIPDEDVVASCGDSFAMNVCDTVCCAHSHTPHTPHQPPCAVTAPRKTSQGAHNVLPFPCYARLCQPPTPALALPYTGSFNMTLTLFETWNSTLHPEDGSPAEVMEAAGQGQRVSVKPFSQWSMTQLSAVAKLTAQRNFGAWTDT